jgi:hypothetical protein
VCYSENGRQKKSNFLRDSILPSLSLVTVNSRMSTRRLSVVEGLTYHQCLRTGESPFDDLKILWRVDVKTAKVLIRSDVCIIEVKCFLGPDILLK